jgi:hypothetical protein
LPRRVHVFEDYETDIERRWLAGREAARQEPRPPGPPPNLALGSRCRSVLTRSTLQGDHQSLYSAVIFNGSRPPIGADAIVVPLSPRRDRHAAVQLYLNGYHRHLTLRLPRRRVARRRSL